MKKTEKLTFILYIVNLFYSAALVFCAVEFCIGGKELKKSKKK